MVQDGEINVGRKPRDERRSYRPAPVTPVPPPCLAKIWRRGVTALEFPVKSDEQDQTSDKRRSGHGDVGRKRRYQPALLQKKQAAYHEQEIDESADDGKTWLQ